MIASCGPVIVTEAIEPAGVHGREPGGDTGAGGRAVDLAISKNANIARRLIRICVTAIGEDRAIEKGQILGIGMAERGCRLHRSCQRIGGINKSRDGVTAEFQAELTCIGQRIKRPAIGDVKTDLAQLPSVRT